MLILLNRLSNLGTVVNFCYILVIIKDLRKRLHV
jgi:hypothetical protein